jgi:hypothetical protein
MADILSKIEGYRMKAQNIAKREAAQILEEMDICDKDHVSYSKYRYNLEYELYQAIKKTLSL